MKALQQRLAHAAARFDPETRVFGLARSGIAVGQLILLLWTPAAYLFVPVLGRDESLNCDAVITRLGMYCVLGDQIGLQAVQWILVAALILVAVGIFPRVTGVLHYYVTVSISASISLPDGGEAVAQVATFFLMLIAFGDRRWNHWISSKLSRNEPRFTQALAWAASWGLRCQMAYIYASSAILKIGVDPWSDGTAVYYVAHGEFFGTANPLEPLVTSALDLPLLALSAAWGTIIAESSIAVLLLIPHRRAAKVALTLSATLHLVIIAVIGLWTFALIIVFAVVGATSWAWGRGLAHAPDAAADQPQGDTEALFALSGDREP